MADKPVLFVGSSTEGLEPARRIQQQLELDAQVVPWTDGVFGLGRTPLEALVRTAQDADFAALVLTPDDLVVERGEHGFVPRDNVLFELGLFIGALGRDRTFLVYSRDDRPALPTDLDGITAATFSGPHRSASQAILGPACTLIRDAMRSLGRRTDRLLTHHPLKEPLDAIAKVTLEAMRSESIVFRDEVKRRVAAWVEKAGAWNDRTVIARTNYVIVLLDAYRNAQRNIFSTSIPAYLPAWQLEWGRNLLQIQDQNRRARSTRVFIFKRRVDVTEAHRAVFETHRKSRVEVLLHFADEHESTFPAELGHDWTVVDDGNAIGVTQKLGDLYEAMWYFHNTAEAERFKMFRDRLRAASHPFAG
jgi:Predicted nucleotide-binding protein containing TIR-like domain